jgi:hypothetical protein
MAIAMGIRDFFEEQVCQFREHGVEAHASLMGLTGEQISVGLRIYGVREDAELSIDVLATTDGIEIDGAVVGGDGRRICSFGPVTANPAEGRAEALRMAEAGLQIMIDRFWPTSGN